MLNKEKIVFDRDEDGNILPREVELQIDETDEYQLPFKGETILITPMPRGEIKRLFSTLEIKDGKGKIDVDVDMIVKHCKTPELNEKDLDSTKQSYISMITNTIMRESGLQTTVSRKKALDKKESDFSKN